MIDINNLFNPEDFSSALNDENIFQLTGKRYGQNLAAMNANQRFAEICREHGIKVLGNAKGQWAEYEGQYDTKLEGILFVVKEIK